MGRVSAVTIAAELGEVSRFTGARELMGYGGIVASEHSSGVSTRRGGDYQDGECTLRRRQEEVSEEIREIAWKAQHRLHARYRKLVVRGKARGKVVTAIGREAAWVAVERRVERRTLESPMR